MGYTAAISKGWEELAGLSNEKKHDVRFLNDRYGVDLETRDILSVSCNVPAKGHLSILILHYLARKLKGLAPLGGEWISFKELAGGQGYYLAYKKRVIDTILRKYGENPEGLLGLIERFKAKKAQTADISVVLDTFDDSAPLLITLWRGDDEFGPEVNVLYDKSITDIFCTEDIVVLSEIVAHSV